MCVSTKSFLVFALCSHDKGNNFLSQAENPLRLCLKSLHFRENPKILLTRFFQLWEQQGLALPIGVLFGNKKNENHSRAATNDYFDSRLVIDY